MNGLTVADLSLRVIAYHMFHIMTHVFSGIYTVSAVYYLLAVKSKSNLNARPTLNIHEKG